ncbi:bifunctional DNA-binding transcriptional regulator/O6-methylguanine-DNA methyltransferase Ada [Tundrisphaera sp. TA3]|uniref:bifunctional DNA-binding transcriptional regulator/O6-methylguanine-DNA methyltransferase Ada n=1 Tax=Tundrisphaera sp. TA3 TaxID=3435775 RepID=UPI003EB8D1B1
MTTQATDDPRWAAIVARDPTADGRFWYAVRTTGIYCRPSCPSRLPNRANVLFFDACDAAERRGFRACKRCRPGRPEAADPIVLACRAIEAADNPPGLESLARMVGLSPAHFHRRFRAETGVTPRGYALAVRARRLRDGLARGAGIGPGGRISEGANAMLGMTASEIRRGADGLRIGHASAPCPLGWVLVAATDRGVCWIELGDDPDALRSSLAARFPGAELRGDDPDLAARVAAVVAYLADPARGLDLPLDIRGTAFQRQVWEALRQIPPGSTASYAEVARRIGQPSAARAVARACASNTIALAIPCHRVVRGDGQMGGFRWGIGRKRSLLDAEASARPGLFGEQATDVVEDDPGGQ